jgi:hypothetical protein
LVLVTVAAALAESLKWAVGFFFGNTELSLELWNIIAGISGFDDCGLSMRCPKCGARVLVHANI